MPRLIGLLDQHFESEGGEGDKRYFRKFWPNVVEWLGENSGRRRRGLA